MQLLAVNNNVAMMSFESEQKCRTEVLTYILAKHTQAHGPHAQAFWLLNWGVN